MITGIASALLIMHPNQDLDIIIWADVFLSANLMIYLMVSIEDLLDSFDGFVVGDLCATGGEGTVVALLEMV